MGITEDLRAFMMKELQASGFDDRVRDDDSLVDAGILDSLSILKLLSFMDERYGVLPEDDELSPDKLDTVRIIAEFIARKLETK